MADFKSDLHQYLKDGREILVWKLDGLDEYDIRRPLTPTGTNLLGLVKHQTRSELVYFGAVFGRRHDAPIPGEGSTEPHADMWARADESREAIIAWYQRAWAITDATVEALPPTPSGGFPGGATKR